MRSVCGRLMFLLLWFASGPVILSAQNATGASTHVFPQVVDGLLPDGSGYYQSTIVITNVSGGGPAVCTLTTFGASIAQSALTANRFSATQVSVPNYSWQTIASLGQERLTTGYVKLSCTRSVTAVLTYRLVSGGSSLGMASVLSSATINQAYFSVVGRTGYRYGVAIANDSDSPITLTAFFTVFSTGGQLGGKTITVNPRSQYSAFIDEIVGLTSPTDGSFELITQGGAFYLTGLVFDGATFATVPPTVIR